MTPKEKAHDLFLSYFERLPDYLYDTFEATREAREFALIAVDEIIKSSPTYPWAKDVGAKAQGLYENVIFPTNYWRDVKSEILQIKLETL